MLEVGWRYRRPDTESTAAYQYTPDTSRQHDKEITFLSRSAGMAMPGEECDPAWIKQRQERHNAVGKGKYGTGVQPSKPGRASSRDGQAQMRFGSQRC
jgi:hypothetical protein